LQTLDVEVAGKRWLDAGASTGGFTDRLLQGGAAEVVAVDVGYGQFDWKLRNDPRVTLIERTNVRTLAPGDVPWAPEGVVADLSFISLTLVVEPLAKVAAPEADHILLVKPQFEVGRDALDKGVVRDPNQWREAIERVVAAAGTHGLTLVDVALAHPAGPAGNREFFIHLRRGGATVPEAISKELERASGEV
jgi:23S rRNA (cytidine1920-2'-O)/16S rRNA (cytidine1409-2'-O)-methyltransferase